MTDETADSDSTDARSLLTLRSLAYAGVAAAFLYAVSVPAAAMGATAGNAPLTSLYTGLLDQIEFVVLQSDPFCSSGSASSLGQTVEGFFQLTAGVGLVGLVAVWQMESLMGVFAMSPEQKRSLKEHKRDAGKAAIMLLAIGPLYVAAQSAMGLPMGDCLSLSPF